MLSFFFLAFKIPHGLQMRDQEQFRSLGFTLPEEWKLLLPTFAATCNVVDHSLFLNTLSSLGFCVTLSLISFYLTAGPSPPLLLAV